MLKKAQSCGFTLENTTADNNNKKRGSWRKSWRRMIFLGRKHSRLDISM